MARAVLFHGPGRPLEVRHFPTPSPRGAEILVRVLCCMLCSSDLHTHAGRRRVPTPTVLGHEIVGEVEARGPDAPRIDGRVSWSVVASCGACFFCATALPQKCEWLHKYGHEPFRAESPFRGGLAEYVLLAPGTAVFRVPNALCDPLAAMANCATATVAAVLRISGQLGDRNVLILGAGLLGLTASAMARCAGAKQVIVSDPDPARRQVASDFGATHVASADVSECAALLAEVTQGRGADVVLELAGVQASVQSALVQARIGGVIILAGTVLPTPAVALDPEQVVRRMLTIRGVHNYVPDDLHTALDFLAGPGRAFPFASLIGRSFRLDEVEEAFAEAHANPGVRVAVVP